MILEKTVVMSQKAKTLARSLLRRNRGTRSNPGRSWRAIARDDYGDKINNATLCRIALSDGEWIPKDNQTQILLGLKRAPRARTPHAQQQYRDLFDMPTGLLLWKLIHRERVPL
jgi:hypothetical protein